MNNKKLPMRNGVGVIILNKNNQVFVAKRNFLNFFGILNHIKKNYKKIQKEI